MIAVAGVILAAGRGRRFRGDKLLASVSETDTVIKQSIEVVSLSLNDYICIVRKDDEELQSHLSELGAPWIISPDADEGMSQSLITGIEHFSDADGWLIILGDMPYIDSTTCQLLCREFTEHLEEHDAPVIFVPVVDSAENQSLDIVNSEVCENNKVSLQLGNPVLFSHHFYHEILQLTGDKGGRAILSAYPDSVHLVTVDDPGILIDIDVPEDIKSYS